MRERRTKVRVAQRTISEQRTFVRMPKKSVLRFGEFGFFEEPPRYFDTHYKDISGNGVLFESPRPLALGTVLKLDLRIQGWDRFKVGFYKDGQPSVSEPLVVLAQVVRVETIESDKRYDIGVVFVGIDEGHQDALMKLISAHYGV